MNTGFDRSMSQKSKSNLLYQFIVQKFVYQMMFVLVLKQLFSTDICLILVKI